MLIQTQAEQAALPAREQPSIKAEREPALWPTDLLLAHSSDILEKETY
jgi:hypothetical protein